MEGDGEVMQGCAESGSMWMSMPAAAFAQQFLRDSQLASLWLRLSAHRTCSWCGLLGSKGGRSNDASCLREKNRKKSKRQNISIPLGSGDISAWTELLQSHTSSGMNIGYFKPVHLPPLAHGLFSISGQPQWWTQAQRPLQGVSQNPTFLCFTHCPAPLQPVTLALQAHFPSLISHSQFYYYQDYCRVSHILWEPEPLLKHILVYFKDKPCGSFLHLLNQIKHEKSESKPVQIQLHRFDWSENSCFSLLKSLINTPLVNTHCVHVRLLNGRQAGGICNREG